MSASLAEAGRVALVTGASRGIGAACAIELARRGITPVLAVRTPDSARTIETQARALGAPASIVRCDVSDPRQARDAIAETLERHGRLDILINNAGVVDPIGRIGDIAAEDFAHALQINLAGPYNMIAASLDSLRQSASATLINISTGAAHGAREGWAAYCSGKAGLWMLTQTCALEWPASEIAVFGLQPGMVDTDMQVRIRASGINEVSRVPRAQLGPAERAARLIAWIADARPIDLHGRDLSIRDAALLERSRIDQ
jgi:NAD(P)-dependent dehydrogenase (short-subunit alcohol dehydrogenase family)